MKHKHTIPSPPLSDEELLVLYHVRDERALVETDRKYRALLDTVARRILPDARDREECLDDTYLKVWNAIPPAQPTSLQAYLAQTMRHTAIDRHYQNHAAHRPPAALTESMEDYADLLSGGEAPDEAANAEAVGHLINAFLHSCPARQRFIFIERFYLHEPVDSIAHTLGLGKSAVYKILTRTKRELKAYLAENGVYV